MTGVHVRHGQRQDLEAITALYNHFVENTIVTFDVGRFTAAEREPWLAQFGPSGRHQLFVAELDGVFAGYAGSMKHKVKTAYETSVETTIYVAPAAARRGVGRALYQRLFEALSVEDVHIAVAGIALPNDGSVAFHKAFGFEVLGTFHEIGRKFGRFHDVMWFEKRL